MAKIVVIHNAVKIKDLNADYIFWSFGIIEFI